MTPSTAPVPSNMIRRRTMKKESKRTSPAAPLRREQPPRRAAGLKTVPAQGLKEVVAEVREGDGVDPRDEAKHQQRLFRASRSERERGDHRKERFAAQVQESIDSVLRLAAEPLLNALAVREIAPQGATLLVVVEPRDPDLPFDLAAAARALSKAKPLLMREIAREITRKETPTLTFVVLPPGAERLGP